MCLNFKRPRASEVNKQHTTMLSTLLLDNSIYIYILQTRLLYTLLKGTAYLSSYSLSKFFCDNTQLTETLAKQRIWKLTCVCTNHTHPSWSDRITRLCGSIQYLVLCEGVFTLMSISIFGRAEHIIHIWNIYICIYICNIYNTPSLSAINMLSLQSGYIWFKVACIVC